jgi:hypothetical protein
MDMLRCAERVIFPEAVKRYSSANFGIGVTNTNQGGFLYSVAVMCFNAK